MAAKYGMVLDLDRCIGCYTCVVACKMVNGTRPDINYNGVETMEWGEYPQAHQRYLLTMCMHCENPSCVTVCPSGATYRVDDGAVLIDYDKCIGCGYCITACPYEQRHYVSEDETSFPGHVAPYEEESSQRLGLVEKCHFCHARVLKGDAPACTVHCPGQCRKFGDVNDPESDIAKYIAKKGAVQIEGTSIYYVIPEGMAASALPAAFQTPGFVTAVEKFSHPVGKGIMGLAAAAVVGGVVINAAKGGYKNDDE